MLNMAREIHILILDGCPDSNPMTPLLPRQGTFQSETKMLKASGAVDCIPNHLVKQLSIILGHME